MARQKRFIVVHNALSLLLVPLILTIISLFFTQLFFVQTVTANVAGSYADEFVVTASALNLRSGPSTDHPSIDLLPRGTRVRVTNFSPGGWSSVEVGGRSGFVYSAYIRRAPAPPPPLPQMYRTFNYQNLVLAPGSNESQRRFNWYTEQSTSWLFYRVQGADTYMSLQAESRESTSRRGLYLHRATIGGLLPSTTYEYMLMDASGTQSQIYTFRTSDPSDFSFFVVGDIQIGAGDDILWDTNAWVTTMNVATANFPQAGMILSVGDQVHGGGSLSAYDALLRPIQLSRLPFAPTVGNHESGTRLFAEHFNLPNEVPFDTGLTQMNYWFRYGDVLFMVLNSNTTNIEAHRSFLHTAINGNTDALWRVLMFHHGPYTEFRAQHYGPKVAIRNYWIPLIDSLGIDVVFNGHCHSYNRTFHMLGNEPIRSQTWLDQWGNIQSDATGLLYNTVFQPRGTIYFTLNSSTGNRFYQLAGREPRFFTASRNQANLPNFTVVNVSSYRFSVATYQVNPDGTTTAVDSYTIVRELG